MTIEATGPDGSIVEFPEGTPTSTMQTALAKVYGGPQTPGSALAQLGDPGPPQLSPASDGGQSALSASPTLQGQSDPITRANLALAPLPPGGGYGPIADATKAAASPWLNALASDPSPVWNQRLGLLGHARALREAASSMAGSMLDNGDSPAMAGLALDPDSDAWTLPKRLDGVTAGPAPTAATWLGLYHTLPSLMQTDPWTGQPLSDADSPRNANIADIAGQLSDAFIGDPFTIRAAHDAMDGTLFSSDPDALTPAWAKASTPAEQAAARSAVASEIQDRIHNGQVPPGQLGSPFMQNRLAPMFGPAGAKAIAAQAESLLASRYAASADGQISSAPAVTAPPTPALAMDAQPFVPMTPIAASLIQGFDPGGVASSLLPAGVGHGDSGISQGRSVPAAPLQGPLLAPPRGLFASGDRYSEGGEGASLLDAAGNPEIVITARRPYPINYFAGIPRDWGSGHFPGAAGDLWRGLYQFANPDSVGFYQRQLHSVPLTPAQLAPVRQDQAAQQAADNAYSLSPSGIVLGAPVAASALLLGATAADVAPLIVRGTQAISNAALRFAVKYPRAVTAGGLATRQAYGSLTGTNPAEGAPGGPPDPVDVDRYVNGLRSTPTPTSKPAFLFEIEQTGPVNYKVVGRNATFDIDGYTGPAIDEAKFVGDASKSPYVAGSRLPDTIRSSVFEQQRREFQRIRSIISDPTVPFTELNVLTNHTAAVPYFRNLMDLHDIPGSVKVVPTKIPFR